MVAGRDEMATTTDDSFEALLRFMRDSRGFDFTGYKRTTLMRRVRHRMAQVNYETFEEYLDLLQASSEEFSALFNTILINVTAFFRDPDAWQYIADDVIPRLLAECAPEDPIRVWSAGCAAGQEAYTLAMLLAEALGTDAFRRRVKIYATDVDEDALTEARAATYDAKATESVPAAFLEKYFEQVDGRCVFDKDLRRAVIFGRNDLVKDAPISRVDLLACRNTLMYLNGETQRNVLGRLFFGLAANGILFLGHAEMLLSHADKFTPLSLAHRVFRKVAAANPAAGQNDMPTPMIRQGDLTGLAGLHNHAFRAGPVAQIGVTGDDTVAMINEQAEATFGLSARDIGRLLRDLEISYRPLELRSYLDQAKADRRSARIPDVQWTRTGRDIIVFEIHVNPLIDADNGLIGTSIAFFDVTSTRTLLDKVVDTNRQLESAYEELQSTNEELETTNEELQSTVEELETTNEELQSTNEELETMNEELQSTNDELHTINDTLNERSGELEEARTFSDSLVNSVRSGLVVVDRETRVLVWNSAAAELWGVRTDEVTGAALAQLDIGLPMDDIKPMIGNAFVDADSAGTAIVEAVNRRGRAVRLLVSCTAWVSTTGAITGALLLMEPPGRD